jgi:hypothetical protein
LTDFNTTAALRKRYPYHTAMVPTRIHTLAADRAAQPQPLRSVPGNSGETR